MNVNLLTMRNPHGNAIIIMPGDKDKERDTFQCCHCGRHTRMKVTTASLSSLNENYCRLCDQPHCGKGDCFVCIPFEKKMEAYERRTVDLGTLTRMLL